MKSLLSVLGVSLSLLAGPVLAQSKPDIVEVLEVTGEIGNHTAAQIKEQVEKINENPKVKAVLMTVQSPGGGAIATSNAYEELGKLKVPVIAWCNTMCASGGYYIMTSPVVKHIGVRNDSIVGSIGVIMTNTRFHRLLDYLKIDNEVYKSGSLKDAGNPTRAQEQEEKEYLQGITNSLASNFYEVVDKARGAKISQPAWTEIKKAKIFIGKDSVKVGLTDQIMTYEQALEKAKTLSGTKTNIFTRQELKKMTKDASDGPNYGPVTPPTDFRYGELVDLIKEVKSGSSIRFEYRLPYKF